MCTHVYIHNAYAHGCTLQVWSTLDNSCVASMTAGKKPVTHMALCSTYLYSAAGRKLRMWDLDTLSCVHAIRIANHCGYIKCLLPLPGMVLLGCQDATVKGFVVDDSKWKEPSGRPMLTRQPSGFEGGQGRAMCVCVCVCDCVCVPVHLCVCLCVCVLVMASFSVCTGHGIMST